RALAFGWSAADRAESEPAKSPVPATNAVTPAPDPTLLYPMVACGQLIWYSRIQVLTALACAEDPWPWMVPVSQAMLAGAGPAGVAVHPPTRSSSATAAAALIGTPPAVGGRPPR